MRAIRVIFAVFLGVTGIIGCASSERLYSGAATSTIPGAPVTLSLEDFPDTIDSEVTEDSAAALDSHLRNQLAQSSEAPVVTRSKPVEAKSGSDTTEKKNISAAKPHPSEERSNQNLRADNRLLELLDKDFDKAVEQPVERRRLQFSKQVVDNPKVRQFVKYYSSTGKIRFQELLERSGKYMPMISKVLRQEGLPQELGYLALLESEFVATTRSRNGAVGLWQLVATTARQYGLRIDEWVDERRDPVKSTRAAARYLKDLHDYYGRWYLAAAAYNAGPRNVDNALRQSGARDFWSIKAKAQLSEETRNFVPKFVAIALIAMDPKKYGFDEVLYATPLDYEEVELKTPMKIAAIASVAGMDVATVRSLNPALLRDTTPPSDTAFRVNLPVEKASLLLAKSTEKPVDAGEPAQIVTHEVRRGETLFSIARFYGLTVRALMEFNGLTTPHIRIGQTLRIFLDELRGVLR